MTEIQTRLIYITLTIVCIILSLKTQTITSNSLNNGKTSRKFNILPFLTVFVLLWIFSGFFINNPDYNNYCYWVKNINFSNIFTYSTEIGFNLLIAFLKLFTIGNVHLVLFLIKSISIIIIAVSFYILRNKINLSYGITAYILLFYFYSIMLIRMSLALSLITLACSCFLTAKSRVIFVLLMIFAGLIHTSALIVLILFSVIYVVYYKKANKYWLFLFAILFTVVILNLNMIINYLNAGILLKFAVYQMSYSQIGLGFILNSILLLFIIIIINKTNPNNKYVFTIDYLYLVILLFRFLGFYNPVATRLSYYCYIIYFIFIPYFMNQNSKINLSYIGKGKIQFSTYGFLIWIIMVLFGIMNMNDAIQYIPVFEFFNPFIF